MTAKQPLTVFDIVSVLLQFCEIQTPLAHSSFRPMLQKLLLAPFWLNWTSMTTSIQSLTSVASFFHEKSTIPPWKRNVWPLNLLFQSGVQGVLTGSTFPCSDRSSGSTVAQYAQRYQSPADQMESRTASLRFLHRASPWSTQHKCRRALPLIFFFFYNTLVCMFSVLSYLLLIFFLQRTSSLPEKERGM